MIDYLIPHLIPIISILAQSPPSPDSLPGWIQTGGTVSSIAVLGWLLFRAERRLDEAQKRNDSCEERYRTMVDKYGERTFESVQALREAATTVRSLAERDHRG